MLLSPLLYQPGSFQAGHKEFGNFLIRDCTCLLHCGEPARRPRVRPQIVLQDVILLTFFFSTFSLCLPHHFLSLCLFAKCFRAEHPPLLRDSMTLVWGHLSPHWIWACSKAHGSCFRVAPWGCLPLGTGCLKSGYPYARPLSGSQCISILPRKYSWKMLA
jgi:hypothetical protein